jgi:hypothetical protein
MVQDRTRNPLPWFENMPHLGVSSKLLTIYPKVKQFLGVLMMLFQLIGYIQREL